MEFIIVGRELEIPHPVLATIVQFVIVGMPPETPDWRLPAMTQLPITGRLLMVIRPLCLACISMPEPALELISQFMIAGLLPSRSSIPLLPLFSIRQPEIAGDAPEQ